MQVYTFLFVLFSCSICVGGFNQKMIKKSILFPSKKETKYNIILFPGFGKKPFSYKNLCDKISENLDDSVSFLVLDYENCSPFYLERYSKEITKECLQHLKTLDRCAEKTFLMGHSAGGYYTTEPAELYCDGLILMGCTMNSQGKLPWKQRSLQEYKKPVLTLLGEKDGYISYLHSIQEYQDLQKKDYITKPIVIEKNVNHLQMCDNIDSGIARLFNKVDFESPISLEQAHNSLSQTISSFIMNDTYVHYRHNQSYAKIQQYNQLEKSINNLSVQGQYCVICPKKSMLLPIQNTEHQDMKEFLFSKPKIEDDGLIKIHSLTEKTRLNNLYSPSLWLKTKNQETVKQHPKYQYLETKKESSAACLNRKIFKKYFTGENSSFVFFEHDIVCKDNFVASPGWIASEIMINYNKHNNTLHICSPVLYTSNKLIPRFAGMKYMKLLTPQMVKEIESVYF